MDFNENQQMFHVVTLMAAWPCLLMRFEPLWKWFQIVTLSTKRVQAKFNMSGNIEKYRLCEFHLNALAVQKSEFCDFLITLWHLQ